MKIDGIEYPVDCSVANTTQCDIVVAAPKHCLPGIHLSCQVEGVGFVNMWFPIDEANSLLKRLIISTNELNMQLNMKRDIEKMLAKH